MSYFRIYLTFSCNGSLHVVCQLYQADRLPWKWERKNCISLNDPVLCTLPALRGMLISCVKHWVSRFLSLRLPPLLFLSLFVWQLSIMAVCNGIFINLSYLFVSIFAFSNKMWQICRVALMYYLYTVYNVCNNQWNK